METHIANRMSPTAPSGFFSDTGSALAIHRRTGAPSLSERGSTVEDRRRFYGRCAGDWHKAFTADTVEGAALRDEFNNNASAFAAIMAARLEAV